MRSLMQKLAFAGGLMTVAVVILPPLGSAAQQLFALHMAQHLLLIAVAAPLLIVSRAFDGLSRLTPVREATKPASAWIGFVGVFLFWHWPAAFQWAAGSAASRLLEYGTILAAAMLFWSVALSDQGHERFSYGARALFVMTAAVATDLPGVIMVFSPRAICTMPDENALRWGLTPLQDQQIAGLLMWVPANLVFFGIATWLFARWISGASPHKPFSQVMT